MSLTNAFFVLRHPRTKTAEQSVIKINHAAFATHSTRVSGMCAVSQIQKMRGVLKAVPSSNNICRGIEFSARSDNEPRRVYCASSWKNKQRAAFAWGVIMIAVSARSEWLTLKRGITLHFIIIFSGVRSVLMRAAFSRIATSLTALYDIC